MVEPHEKKLGTIDGRKYFLFLKVWPSWHRPEEFIATLYYRRTNPETGERERREVAQIENRSHRDQYDAHIDRLWTEEQDMEAFPFQSEESVAWEAWNHLKENWEKYARRYQNNHG